MDRIDRQTDRQCESKRDGGCDMRKSGVKKGGRGVDAAGMCPGGNICVMVLEDWVGG